MKNITDIMNNLRRTEAVTQPPAAVTPASTPSRGGLNLSRLKKKGTGAKKDDTIYVPANIIPPDLADETLAAMEAFKNAEGVEKELKGEIVRASKPWFFERFEGCEAPSSVVCLSNGPNELTVAFKNDYRRRIDDIQHVASIIGPELASQHFEEKVTVAVNVDKIPEANRQAFIDAIVDLADKLNCEGAIEVDSKWKPKSGFHQTRMQFGSDVNAAIEMAFGGSSFTTSISKRRKK